MYGEQETPYNDEMGDDGYVEEVKVGGAKRMGK